MNQSVRPLLRYRLFVFGLALVYWLYQFKAVGSGFGWQFRYLTIWALTLSLISAAAMLRHSLGRGGPPYALAAVTAVVNGLVVLSYWRLYFTDPSLVNSAGIAWWQEYYLHLVGPVLQWIDALVLFGAFRKPWRTLGWLVTLILAYVGWIELAVQPRLDWPQGSVTSGLPYPFLNDMAFDARLGFYAATGLSGLVLLAAGTGATWARRRVLQVSESSSARSPSRYDG
ncbi:hypothetical protein [Tranquillimonas alkanivorans]|uniref:FAR-17a/AIG1-like protein n=1 Tax=Tranquillimonas alkanivorans TaxID=441119 RepID=A0A1I5U541_9RHOB|nr:hypothetical protein [Tranquillimonas alkanivorans]SFP90047.1 FAR-17a/AIG1-like protein [Tranquillimonas alkanivorans]